MMQKKTVSLVKSLVFLILTLVILITPQVHSAFLNQSFSKSLYPDGSYIITTTPTASFPNDHTYCYIGENNLDVQVVFYNYDGSTGIVNHIDDELDRADINIDWHFTSIDEPQIVYFDFEFEILMQDYRHDSNSDYVLVFTTMDTPDDGEYYNLGGYARLQNHFGIVFTNRLVTSTHISAIGLHEITHLLGYWHSEHPQDVMYPNFSGSNICFTDDTVDVLYELHH